MNLDSNNKQSLSKAEVKVMISKFVKSLIQIALASVVLMGAVACASEQGEREGAVQREDAVEKEGAVEREGEEQEGTTEKESAAEREGGKQEGTAEREGGEQEGAVEQEGGEERKSKVERD